eukprot:TRINITY_DN259_c0_g1_i1.p1 TRINITY_DN259_c0_g1~~TRINITY_DN259_c0_g1_i1.p1  ORF type:complete len:555 (+),score=141.69 TRINITY_DN259_c0_g1_i1:41-1705(+)
MSSSCESCAPAVGDASLGVDVDGCVLGIDMMPFESFRRGLVPSRCATLVNTVMQTVAAPSMTFDQKKSSLERIALGVLPYPAVSDDAAVLVGKRVIDMIGESGGMYHPRYCAPDYAAVLQRGFAFLELQPATDLHMATASLLACYSQIPTGLPVFIGNLDTLLEPYIDSVVGGEQVAKSILKSFWMLVDRLNPTAFAHANIGPKETKVGRMLLDIDLELKTITNLSLLYDPEETPDSFALMAIRNQLALAKPYFINHPAMKEIYNEHGGKYVIASCYNSMPLKGGIFTLIRVNLLEMVKLSNGTMEDLLQNVIPKVAEKTVEIINSRCDFITNTVKFFENDPWTKEGLLDPSLFGAYPGIHGLADAVNYMTEKLFPGKGMRYGKDETSNKMGLEITKTICQELEKHPAPLCKGWKGGKVIPHAQVGISQEKGVTPALRIPAGEEPDLYDQIMCEAPLHKWVPGGVSSIIEFDFTAKQNPKAVLDIIQGGFKNGMLTISVGSSESEFVRVTGYLVRRSDVKAFSHGEVLRHTSAALGGEFCTLQNNTLHRRERKV